MSDANKDTNPKEIPSSCLQNMEEQVENKAANTNVEPAPEPTSSTQNSHYSVYDNENLASSTTYSSYSGLPYPGYNTYDYTGFRPAGIMSFLLGLSCPRRMSADHDDVSYGDEPQPESDPNLAPQTCYYRPMRQQTDQGQPSSLKTGFPKTMSYQGPRRQRNQLVNVLPLLLAGLLYDRKFSKSSQGAEEDIYDGPYITEIIDEEDDLPVPALQSTSDPAKRTGITKNKNTGVQKTPVVQQNSMKTETDQNSTRSDKGEKEVKEDQNDETTSVLGSKNNDQELSESSCKKIQLKGQRKSVPLDEHLLRRKRSNPSITDNRYEYLQDELQRCLLVSPEQSNVSCIVGKSQSWSKAVETSTPLVNKGEKGNLVSPSLKDLHSNLKHNHEEEEESRKQTYRSGGRQTKVGGGDSKTEITPSFSESNRSVVNIEQTGRKDKEQKRTNENDNMVYDPAKSQPPAGVETQEYESIFKETPTTHEIGPNRINQFFSSQRNASSSDQFNNTVKNVTGSKINYLQSIAHKRPTTESAKNTFKCAPNFNEPQKVRHRNHTQGHCACHHNERTDINTREEHETIHQSQVSDVFGKDARQCEGCGMIHIHCKQCQTILHTFCSDCQNCDKILSAYLNQNPHQSKGGNPELVHKSASKSIERYGSNKTTPDPNQTVHNTTVRPGNYSSSNGGNDTGSGSKSAGSDVNTTGQFELQYPPDVPTFDQPESGQLNDALNLNVPENQTPAKPPRNKNATKKSSSFAGKSTTSDVSSSVQSGSKISSPNFTISSYHQVQGNRSYQPDSAGSGSYPSQQCSGDRLSNLSEAMREKGMIVKDVYPDGNCLFAAIVDQLRVRGEFFFTPKSLRQAAVRYLKEHPNQADGTPLFEFVSNHENLTWEDYLKRLNRDGEWADHIIISAIPNVLRRRLVIHSILQAGKQVNETVMEPDLKGMSRERELPIKTDDFHAPAQTHGISAGRNTRKLTREERESQEELLEDLQLGHIPEAHYVSLRYRDWEDKLHTTLKKRKDDPTTHLTAYGHKPTRESNNSSSDSNEDFGGQIPTQHFYCLPNTHFNFLLKYLRDGNFLQKSESFKYWHGKFQSGFEDLFTIWGVGDRFNALESYLVTEQVETSAFDRYNDPAVWYTVFANDIIVSKKGNVGGQKQLVPDETGCKLGYLKLEPENPTLWRQNIREENGNYYLKHLYFQTKREDSTVVPIHVTFKCEWPEAALECKERMTQFRVKGDEDMQIMTKKVVEGVRVVPVCSENYTCRDADCLEWKYSFSAIEYVFCMNIITCNARFCFQIMEHFLRFVFCGKNIINKEHQKSVFFYTCDELDIGNNNPNFLSIVSYFMLRLESCLEARNIPDFFFRAMNLIEQVDEKDISWHYERVCLVRSQYLIYMFFFLDQNGLLEHFKLSSCFNTLLSDAYKVAPNPYQCSKKLTVMVAREWVVAQRYNFHKAKRLIDNFKSNVTSPEEDTESEGDLPADTPVSTKLHKRVMKGLPLQEQWLYAFFLEIETGVPFLEHVCKEQKCEKLQNFFGESIIQILITDKKTKNPCIELPVDIAQQEGIARFAVKFGEVLRKQMLDSSAYIAGIHFFLSQHAESLLDTFDDSQKHEESRVPFHAIVQPLIHLFLGIHSQYLNSGRRVDFLDLMPSFERLCDYTQYVADYELLAQLWVLFGDTERASTAMMKANSLKKNNDDK